MASAPQAAALPMFYQDLMPLNSRDHAEWTAQATDKATWMVNQHAIPLTAEEFIQAQRHFPIIFSNAADPVPLALMAMNEGMNTFFDDEGKMIEPVYVPAYARRYPYMLAKLTPETDELSLCFDPTSNLLGENPEGARLFENGEPTDATKATLEFCKNFEEAGMRTQAFVEDLKKHNLLMDGEVSIQGPEGTQPFVYRGFKMVDQEKLRDLRGDVLRQFNQSGALALIFAHLFSLEHMSTVFSRQLQQGKGPAPVAVGAA